MASQRENFGSRTAVILALAGSAIGLGNIWRFPYMVGEYGGAAFVIVYILCSLVVALPVMYAESIIGKSTRSDTFGALKKLAPGWQGLAFISITTSFVVLSYYSVVGGWSIDYFVRSLVSGFSPVSGEAGLSAESIDGTQAAMRSSANVFSSMISSVWQPLLCLFVFLGITSLVVLAGVNKGIGRFSKITMPLLFLMIVLIVVRSVSLPGAQEGLDYLLKPDFSKLDGPAIAAALGQSFFSLSLGIGTVLTYSSYMRENQDILNTGLWTAIFDTIFALLAGFAIMPAVFASGLEPSAGPSLVYETLPVIFSQMGAVVPVIFFFAIVIAALTSSISILEVCVAYLVDQKKYKRGKAVLVIFIGAFVLGSFCALMPKVFSVCDFITSNVLMMMGAFIFVIVMGWKIPRPEVLANMKLGNTASRTVFPVVYFLIKWVAPVAILAIAVTNLL